MTIDGAVRGTGVARSNPRPVSRNVAEKKPIAMSYCGSTHAVMMATPDDLEDFGVGFGTTERIFERAEQIPFVITIDGPQRRIRALPSCSEARDSSSSRMLFYVTIGYRIFRGKVGSTKAQGSTQKDIGPQAERLRFGVTSCFEGSHPFGMMTGRLSGHLAMVASSTLRCWATSFGGVCVSQSDSENSS